MDLHALKLLTAVLQRFFGNTRDRPDGVTEEVLLLLGEGTAAGVVEEGLVLSTPMIHIHNQKDRNLSWPSLELATLIGELHGFLFDTRGRGESRELERLAWLAVVVVGLDRLFG